MDPLRLERGEEALHGRVIQAVTPPAHRRLDPVSLQHRLIRTRGVLGGFKWSSQHLDGGGCDEGWETALGSGAPSRVAGVAWPTRRGAAGEPAAVLGGDRGGAGEGGRGGRGRRGAPRGGPPGSGGGGGGPPGTCPRRRNARRG